MADLPPEWQHVVDQLQTERAEQKARLDQMMALLADNNRELKELRKMLRRRESQLKRAERENRKLRRKLGLPDSDDDPEPEPPSSPKPAPVPPASGNGSPAATPFDKKKRPRSRGGRRPPPDHLTEDTERHTVCACGQCGGRVWRKNVETSRLYTVVQAHVRCRVIERERVVCTDCGSSTTAEMPPMPCKRALYDARFLAWLVTMKFGMLVPLDRVRLRLRSQGIDLAMGTLVHLIARAAKLATAVNKEHWRLLKIGPYVAFDGTGLKTLIAGQEKAWDGYLEVFTRDEISVFSFDLTKHAAGLTERLAGVTVPLLCDAESRNRAAAPNNVLAHCNAHPLRKYREALRVQPKLAAQGMGFIGELYDLEDKARDEGLTGARLRVFRQRKSRAVLDRYRRWLQDIQSLELPPSDPVGKVVRYTLSHWDGLTRFVGNPDLPLDNNVSEREFQRHAKLRHASLFAGSVRGAERWATLLGVVRTAQKCGIDVEAYLAWLFEHQGTHRHRLGRSPEQLTPMAFLAEQGARAA
jgi:transposase